MIKLSDLKKNPNNPRLIKDDKFQKLVKSIENFPKMMELRPIIMNDQNIVLGGNMRLAALKELGYKEIPNEWVKKAKDLTPEQQNEFIVKDNVSFGAWDWDILANEWDAKKLEEWGLDLPDFSTDEILEDEQKDLSSNIENLYRIEVICKDEEHQETTYNKLIEQGYECRLLTL
jgi:ParB-like chromosome segregation protein Spo0J